MNTPGISHIQRAETAHLIDLVQGQVIMARDHGGLGKINPKCCPVLRIDARSYELMALVTFADGKPLSWNPGGGTRDAPMWWVDAMATIQGAVSEHYGKNSKAAEDTSGR
jgi:hypothetical protein